MSDVISGLDTNGRWDSSKLETEGTGKNDLAMIIVPRQVLVLKLQNLAMN
ncbi:hypothetical protein [Providencia hangzhouensis]